MHIETITRRRECNLERVKERQRRSFSKYKQANPEKVKLTSFTNEEKSKDVGQKRKRTKDSGGIYPFQEETNKRQKK